MLNSNLTAMNKTLTEQIEEMILEHMGFSQSRGIFGFTKTAKAIEAILDEIIKEREDAVYAKLTRCKRLYQELYEQFCQLKTSPHHEQNTK